jgi:hypothetical protein
MGQRGQMHVPAAAVVVEGKSSRAGDETVEVPGSGEVSALSMFTSDNRKNNYKSSA